MERSRKAWIGPRERQKPFGAREGAKSAEHGRGGDQAGIRDLRGFACAIEWMGGNDHHRFQVKYFHVVPKLAVVLLERSTR
jgi:hypothetical protein